MDPDHPNLLNQTWKARAAASGSKTLWSELPEMAMKKWRERKNPRNKDKDDLESGTSGTSTERDIQGNKMKDSKFFKYVPSREPYTWKNQLSRTVFSNWINVLLLAAPAGIALMYLPVDGTIKFAINFVAILPLAKLLSDSTEQIALRTGEIIGGLINATFGNAVELIVAIIALAQNQVQVVQTSLIGSILSNLLLVMGMCFCCGYRFKEQHFNNTVAELAASLLVLAVGALILPTVFAQTISSTDNDFTTKDARQISQLSRGVAVLLLLVYCFFLWFQLHTHNEEISIKSDKATRREHVHSSDDESKKSLSEGVGAANSVAASTATPGLTSETMNNSELNRRKTERHDPATTEEGQKEKPKDEQDIKPEDSEEEEEVEYAELDLTVAFVVLLVSTVLIAFCAEGMVSGIEAITAAGVSEVFVGLILLPIVGNACEHATAVTMAYKDKMDLALAVAVGSSIQVALFLIPVLVIIGWGMGNEDMNLSFDTFQIVVMFVAVLLVNYLIADSKSNWLEGVMLICLYLIIALCAWWYPEDTNQHTPGLQTSG